MKHPASASRILAGLLLLCACSAPGGTAQPPPGHALDPAWLSLPSIRFEELVLELEARAAPWRWTTEALDTLEAALEAQDEGSVRAAVLLAHAAGPEASLVLLGRLEARHEAPTRARDAGDLVAAAALAGRPEPDDLGRRLGALASGPSPHPDLEVRVECARAALLLGHAEVLPFLLRVLRALTPAETTDPGDWERVTTLAWAKTRAAHVLSRAAGVPCRFRPDGPWQHQMDEAERLEQLLLERHWTRQEDSPSGARFTPDR